MQRAQGILASLSACGQVAGDTHPARRDGVSKQARTHCMFPRETPFLITYNPAGPLPVDVVMRTYASMIHSGRHTWRNFLLFQNVLTRHALRWLWKSGTPFYDAKGSPDPRKIEGFASNDAREIRKHVKIPMLLAGGFQTAHGIAEALRSNACGAVTIARGLLANPNLPAAHQGRMGWAAGSTVFILQPLSEPRPRKPLGMLRRIAIHESRGTRGHVAGNFCLL